MAGPHSDPAHIQYLRNIMGVQIVQHKSKHRAFMPCLRPEYFHTGNFFQRLKLILGVSVEF